MQGPRQAVTCFARRPISSSCACVCETRTLTLSSITKVAIELFCLAEPPFRSERKCHEFWRAGQIRWWGGQRLRRIDWGWSASSSSSAVLSEGGGQGIACRGCMIHFKGNDQADLFVWGVVASKRDARCEIRPTQDDMYRAEKLRPILVVKNKDTQKKLLTRKNQNMKSSFFYNIYNSCNLF